jgi:hypothetical protein
LEKPACAKKRPRAHAARAGKDALGRARAAFAALWGEIGAFLAPCLKPYYPEKAWTKGAFKKKAAAASCLFGSKKPCRFLEAWRLFCFGAFFSFAYSLPRPDGRAAP